MLRNFEGALPMESSKSNNLLLRIVRDIADYQFGKGVGEKIFPDDCKVEISKRTRRPKYVYLGDKLLATIRYPDNLLALTLEGGRRLRDVLGERAPIIVVKEKAIQKLKQGMNLTARDIIRCAREIRPGEEVLVEDERGNLLAIGKASVASRTMLELKRGVVIKVRKARK